MDETQPAAPAVTRTVTLDAPASAVWDELTDHDALVDWLGVAVDGPVAAGATGTHHDDGVERPVRFLDVDPGRALSWRWGAEGADEDTTVTITVDGDDGGTTVTVTETRAAAASCSVAAAVEAPFGSWDQRLLGLELRVLGRRALAAV